VEAQDNVAFQVAEQMADYLLTGAVTNALNTPSVTAEEAPKLKPFVALAEKLGQFAGQVADGGVSEVEIEYEGAVAAFNRKPLTSAALAGMLRPFLAEVNMVSAPAILQERGGSLKESINEASPIYGSLIRIKVKVEGKWRSVAGAIVGGKPRIVEVKGMALEADFQPYMLVVNNSDKPGFIGAMAGLLGEAKVNIATFNLGREAAGGDAIAIVGVDQDVPPATLEAIEKLPQVRYVKVLKF
jgi:D-3-phosphoglycerate dehydrogenase